MTCNRLLQKTEESELKGITQRDAMKGAITYLNTATKLDASIFSGNASSHSHCTVSVLPVSSYGFRGIRIRLY